MKKQLLHFPWFTRPLAVLTLLAVVYGCVKPDDIDFTRIAEIPWSPEIAIPLVNSSLTAADIITKGDRDGRIEVDTAKFCTLVYEGDLFSRSAQELFPIPDQNVPNQDVNMPPASVVAFIAAPVGGTVTYSDNQVINFTTTNGIQIDSIQLKGGLAVFNATTTIQHTVKLTLSLPTVNLNGTAYTRSVILNSGNGWANSVSVNLNQYMVDLTNGGSQTNKLPMVITAEITKEAGQPTPTGSDKFSYTFSITNPVFQRIHGDLGANITLSSGTSDSVRFSAFKNSLFTGHINYADPRLMLSIRNSFGIPANINVTEAKGNIPAPDPGAGDYPLTGTGISNPFTINAPTWSQAGQSITSGRTIDNTNSNVRTVFNLNPEYLIYNMNFTGNPGGTPPQRNFVLDTSSLDAHVRTELPLFGTASGFSIRKQFDFGFEDTAYVEMVTIRANINNGFPIDVSTQIYFADAGLNYIDSLAPTAAARLSSRAAGVDGTGKVNSRTATKSDFPISRQRWERIGKLCKYIIVVSDLESKPTGTDVKIYSNYTIDVKLGIRAQLNVDLNNID